MIIFVDIDHTICKTPEGLDYTLAVPLPERIKKINKLFDQGHTIIYWTARGSGTGLDWSEVTEKQFEEWKVKHHELRLGKPVYDVFIDDTNVNAESFFKSVEWFE